MQMSKPMQYVAAGVGILIAGFLILTTYTSITGAGSDTRDANREVQEALDAIPD